MKNIIRRSSDILLFLIIFIVLIINFKDKINKKNILNYLYNKNYGNNNLFDDNLPLTYNLYRYNKVNKMENTLNISKLELPNVYIFNTHYEEKYSDTDVIEMTKLLIKKLNENNINGIFEDTNYKEYVLTNNLLGINNYIMIRSIIEEKIKSKNMDLVIDLHRDSINKKDSVININGKEYAKVLFVVDNYYKDYQIKYDLANKFHKYLNEKYKGISRGIYVKNGKGFNQDLSKNMILLELGGYQNNKNELENTIDVIVEMIKEFLYE